MVTQYSIDQPGLVLSSDLGGEYPIYLYWPQNQSTLLYSKSITELLNDTRIPKPLKVSTEGVSFLLQSGVVPLPKTAYQDIYILGIGDNAKISTVNGKINIQFSHNFPFLNANRLPADAMKPDENLILQMLAEATINRIDESKPSFLFHSAGKDSNSIALALAEAGWQNKVTLISYKAKGKLDESEISAKIAKQLGFKHQILYKVDQLQSQHKQVISDYFVNAPFPCTDNASLGYPLYTLQIPELKSANIIDGGGNDSHMIVPPTARELKVLPLSKPTHHFSFVRHFVKSESLFSTLIRTPAEWWGMSGMSFADTKQILPNAVNVYPHWKKESQIKKDWDLFYFKTDIYSTLTIQEVHIRKVRNFADSVNVNMVFPWANQRVAKYFSKMPEQYLFDRKTLRNKLVLRKILKDRIGLDSDSLGKFGFEYDTSGIIVQNLDYIIQKITTSLLWHQPGLLKVITRMKKRMNGKGRGSRNVKVFLCRLLLISSWHSHNRFIN